VGEFENIENATNRGKTVPIYCIHDTYLSSYFNSTKILANK